MNKAHLIYPLPKISKFLLLIILLLTPQAAALAWQETKGEHFIVYYPDNSVHERFAQGLREKAEEYYQTIASDLGYQRRSGFWTWDNRVKIYIYADRDSYLLATQQPDWSEGMADYKNKQIASYVWQKDFMESLLPHEIAHLVFRDFVGFQGEIPIWLDEGVAQWEEQEKTRNQLKKKAKTLYDKNGLLSIRDITRLNIKYVKKDDKRLYFRGVRTKNGRFSILVLSPDVLIDTYYVEAGSLIGFLIETKGPASFTNFCAQLRDGKNLEEAIRFAYPNSFQDVRELEQKWREYLSLIS